MHAGDSAEVTLRRGLRSLSGSWQLTLNTERSQLYLVVEIYHTIVTHLLPQYVHIPQIDRLKEIVEGFEICWGFPQAAGAIDGSHIPIIRPDESASDYYNRKGYYSIIMQAMVDFRGLYARVC